MVKMPEKLLWIRSSVLQVLIERTLRNSTTPYTDGKEIIPNNEFEWGWTLAKLTSQTDQSLIIVVQDDNCPRRHEQTLTVPTSFLKKGDVEKANLWTDDQLSSPEGDNQAALPIADDLIDLCHINEPVVIHCLRQRYAHYKIYTQASENILLVINPFQYINGLYSDETLDHYWRHGIKGDDDGNINNDGNSLQGAGGPHAFGMVNKAYRQMMSIMKPKKSYDESSSLLGDDTFGPDQSLLVMGEYGAGKTFTTRIIIDYLTIASQRMKTNSDDNYKTNDKKHDDKRMLHRNSRGLMMILRQHHHDGNTRCTLEEKIIAIHPILESFGNARTIHNDNSSRFGMFMEMDYSKNGILVGATVRTYFLETKRLLNLSRGERNFDVFYQLLEGADEDQLEMLFIDDKMLDDFKILSKSDTYDRMDGVEDEDTFNEMIEALSTMGFERNEIEDLLCVTAAILHAGNTTFETVDMGDNNHNIFDGGGDNLNLSQESNIFDDASNSFTDTDSDTLEDSYDSLNATLEMLQVSKEAFEDAICHEYITVGTERFKRSLKPHECPIAVESFIKRFYNVIFDFLVSRINVLINSDKDEAKQQRAASLGVLDMFGFESLGVNSLEKLCTNYCNEILQQQFNILTFINEKNLYEDEGIKWANIKIPGNNDVIDLKGTDFRSGILSMLDEHCGKPGESDETFAQCYVYNICPKMTSDSVTTETQRPTNKFSIRHDAGTVEYSIDGFMKTNKDKRLSHEMIAFLKSSKRALVRTLATVANSAANAVTSSSDTDQKTLEPSSAVGQFVNELQELQYKINATSPHYIRCIKPNDNLLPNNINPAFIAKQLQCAGIIEAATIHRFGYPYRIPDELFMRRYRILQQPTVRMSGSTIANQDQNLFAALDKIVGDGGIRIGRTKVFMTRHAFQTLETSREKCRKDASIIIQTYVRGFWARMYKQKAMAAITIMQSWMRVQKAMAVWELWKIRKKRERGATTIAAYYRRFRSQKIARSIQTIYREMRRRRQYTMISQQVSAGIRAFQNLNSSLFKDSNDGGKNARAQNERYKKEIAHLKTELEGQRAINLEQAKMFDMEVEEIAALKKRIKEEQNAKEKAEEEVFHLKCDVEELHIKFLNGRQLQVLDELRQKYNKLRDELATTRKEHKREMDDLKTSFEKQEENYKFEVEELKVSLMKQVIERDELNVPAVIHGGAGQDDDEDISQLMSDAQEDEEYVVNDDLEDKQLLKRVVNAFSNGREFNKGNANAATRINKSTRLRTVDSSVLEELAGTRHEAQDAKDNERQARKELEACKQEMENLQKSVNRKSDASIGKWNPSSLLSLVFDGNDSYKKSMAEHQNLSESNAISGGNNISGRQAEPNNDGVTSTTVVKYNKRKAPHERRDIVETKLDNSVAMKRININVKDDFITIEGENPYDEPKEDTLMLKMKNDRLLMYVEDLRSSIEEFKLQLNNHKIESVGYIKNSETQQNVNFFSLSTNTNKTDLYIQKLSELTTALQLIQNLTKYVSMKLEDTINDIKADRCCGDAAHSASHEGDERLQEEEKMASLHTAAKKPVIFV